MATSRMLVLVSLVALTACDSAKTTVSAGKKPIDYRVYAIPYNGNRLLEAGNTEYVCTSSSEPGFEFRISFFENTADVFGFPMDMAVGSSDKAYNLYMRRQYEINQDYDANPFMALKSGAYIYYRIYQIQYDSNIRPTEFQVEVNDYNGSGVLTYRQVHHVDSCTLRTI
jgi:hypothetical protein